MSDYRINVKVRNARLVGLEMQKLFYFILLIFAAVIAAITYFNPEFLADNEFLGNFINHEILNILAVIMTVTAASAANIHLVFNRAEETIKKPGFFNAARSEINENVFWLIGVFLVTVVLLIIRSNYLNDVHWSSFFNGFGLLLLLLNILVLIDTTKTVFAITPILPSNDD